MGPRRNEQIRISPLRVIDANNHQVGVIPRDEALKLAETAGLDLVEIQPDARPPLCKIMDFGKFKYEQSKKQNAANKTKKTTETKEVRLGRSVKIDEHDVEIRITQARRFLLDGHRVMIVQRFRGRELAHPEIGMGRLNDVAARLSDLAKIQTPAKLTGNTATVLLAPDKAKVDQHRRTESRETAEVVEALAAVEAVEESRAG